MSDPRERHPADGPTPEGPAPMPSGPFEPPPDKPSKMPYPMLRLYGLLALYFIAITMADLSNGVWFFLAGSVLMFFTAYLLGQALTRYGTSEWLRGYDEAWRDCFRALNEAMRRNN